MSFLLITKIAFMAFKQLAKNNLNLCKQSVCITKRDSVELVFVHRLKILNFTEQ